MKRIIVLEPNVANKIAAGEVAERPASVVKELVENSIDAGSTAVTVEIRNGGIDYIRITDNGSGIEEIDVPTAFLRHATGKITTAEELNRIETFGFRGEALASVAAVSKVSMRTRTADADHGTHIELEGGKQTVLEQCGCPCGTTVEINELFYNVPARLKFLKSARSEAALIGDYLSRLILSNPDTSIKFINNGKTVYHSYGDGSLENALFCVYDASIVSKLYTVRCDDGYVRISGFAGGETTARNSRSHQSVFVNKRYIKSPGISLAVQRAYDTRLMNGKYPFFVLNITISPYEIDVNVHPNKLSIRFKDEERLSFAVTNAVKKAIEGETDPKISEKEAVAVLNVSNDNEMSLGGNSVACLQKDNDSRLNSDLKTNAANGVLYSVFNRRAFEKSREKPEADSSRIEKACEKSGGEQTEAELCKKSAEQTEAELCKKSAEQIEAKPYKKSVKTADPLSRVASEFNRLLETGDDWSFHDSAAGVSPHTGNILQSPDGCSAGSGDLGGSDFSDDAGNSDASELIDKFGIKTDKIKPDKSGNRVINAEKNTEGEIPVIKVKSLARPVNKVSRPEQIEIGNIPYTVVGVAFDTYIIIQQGEAIYFIDQHAAHERMLYEKFISNETRFDSQLLLMPETIRLDSIAFACVKDNADKFAEIGFSIEFIDDTVLRVSAVPAIIDCSAESFILEAADIIMQKGDVSEKDLVRSRLIQLSCKRAVKAGDRLEDEEIESILHAYSLGKTPLNCPHGRPVIIKLGKTDLEKMFKRIV